MYIRFRVEEGDRRTDRLSRQPVSEDTGESPHAASASLNKPKRAEQKLYI